MKAKAPPPDVATPPVEPDPPKPPDGDPLPPEEPAGSGSATVVESAEAPPSCTEAKAQIAKLARCKAASRELRDGYQKSYTLILEAWSSGSRSPALRDATDKSCATLVKSLVEFRKSACR
jgi:hypothetical protein